MIGLIFLSRSELDFGELFGLLLDSRGDDIHEIFWICSEFDCGSSLQSLEVYLQLVYSAAESALKVLKRKDVSFTVILKGLCGYDVLLEPEAAVIVTEQQHLQACEEANNTRRDNGLSFLDIQKMSFSSTLPAKSSQDASLDDFKLASEPFVCFGGTFDHLHHGHKVLMSIVAYWSNSKTLCGIAGAWFHCCILLV